LWRLPLRAELRLKRDRVWGLLEQEGVVNKRIAINLCKYGVAAGLLTYVIWSSRASLESLWRREEPIHFGYVAAAFVLFGAALALTLVRWFVLVRAQDLPFRLHDALRLGLVGFFFNVFLPGSVGGDVIKAAALAREQSRRTVAVATVIMDRVIALWGLFWFVALLGAVLWAAGLLEGTAAEPSKLTVGGAAVVVGLSTLVWLLLGLLPQHRAERFAGRLGRLPKIGGSAAEFWRAVWMYRCRQKSVGAALLIAWVGFVGFVGAYYCCTQALWAGTGKPLPTLTQHFLIVPTGLVIQAIPGSPGGAGIGEMGFGFLYQWFGCEQGLGRLSMLLQRVLMWVVALGGYLLYLRMKAEARPATAAPVVHAGAEVRLRPEAEATSAAG
jgi:uncharacterized protein (TIRG00374 family)